MNKKRADVRKFRITDHFPDIEKMVGIESGRAPRKGKLIQPEATHRVIGATPDHFVDVNKMIERRFTLEEKKALKKPDTLEGA